MDLLKSLRDDLLNSSIPLTSILRKALVLASELRNGELRQWVNYELNGYPQWTHLPDYRVVTCAYYGRFTNGFAHSDDELIPASALPPRSDVRVDQAPMRQSAAFLEGLVARDEEFVRFGGNTALAGYLSNRLNEGWVCTSTAQVVNRMQVIGVLDGAKTRLLNLVLQLQEEYPDLAKSEETLAQIPKGEVIMAIHNHIYGNQNNVASGSNFQQNVQQRVMQGDFNSLASSLRELGVRDEEVQALKLALEEDGVPSQPQRFGARVKAWIGTATQKALDGLYKVGVDAAPGIITKALAAYYGWPEG